MKSKLSILLLLCAFATLSFAQEIYRTKPIAKDIHSVEVLANKDWNSYPIITLNSSDYIHIGFDQVTEESYSKLRYKIVFCNADWTKNTQLAEIDYLDGFDDNPIENYNSSMNTTIFYTHYNLQIPNRDVKPKLSGNYVVEVYDENGNENDILLTACFSVLDKGVDIIPEVSTTTDIDANKEHHQLSFDLNYKLNVRDVKNDFKIFVRQNNRIDNERKDLKPTYVMPSKLRYSNNKALIFEAGNEYHRFDMSSYRSNGKNVAQIEYKRPYYHIYVVPNRINKIGSYSYDQDQNGRAIYRNADAEDADIEADYFYTHITLHSERKLPYDIYVNGTWSYNSFANPYKMIYSEENSEYYLILFLKQGIYNYQYLVEAAESYSPREIEGSFYEAENEYSIYAYYRPQGQRYDSLVGFTNVLSRKK